MAGVDVVVGIPLAGDLRGVAPRRARPDEVGEERRGQGLDDGPALVAFLFVVVPAILPRLVGGLGVLAEALPVRAGLGSPP